MKDSASETTIDETRTDALRPKSLNLQTGIGDATDNATVVLSRPRTVGAPSSATVAPDTKRLHAANLAVTRALARQMDPAEIERLFREHQDLGIKVATGTATSADRTRFASVRWAIDRLHDAEVGERLDLLEMLIEAKRALAEETSDLIARLEARNKVRKRKSRG